MCTVSYLPKANNCFILTSNRDEDIKRDVALPFEKYLLNNVTLYFPKDPYAGGTWIATGNNGYTVCLLNGAFKKHISAGNYKKSRGLVVLDFFNFNTPKQFVDVYDFTNIEPFTLIFINHQNNKAIAVSELKWDGSHAHYLLHDAKLPHIWSSATLYTNEVVLQRTGWFYDWVKNNTEFTSQNILLFHRFGGNGNTENDLVMNRTTQKTVSISCINKISDTKTEVIYEDVLNKKLNSTTIIVT